MLKSSLAVLAGVIGGSAVIWLIEASGHALFPPPGGVDMHDPGLTSEHLQQMPVLLLSVVLLAYAAGSFAGGWISVAISEKLRDSIIVGLALLGFGIVNLVMITHPLWFIVVSVLIYIPCAYWGGKIRVR